MKSLHCTHFSEKSQPLVRQDRNGLLFTMWPTQILSVMFANNPLLQCVEISKHFYSSLYASLVNNFTQNTSKSNKFHHRMQAGLETYFFSHSQFFASGFNLNSQIAVSNLQLVLPTFEQFLTLRCGMAIVSWGWNLVHRSPLRWQGTCWRLHSSFLCLKKYIIFSTIAVTWQDSESVLRGSSTFPLPLL